MRPRELAVLLAGLAVAAFASGIPAAGWLLAGATAVAAATDSAVSVVGLVPAAATLTERAIERGDMPAVALAAAVIGIGVLVAGAPAPPPAVGRRRWLAVAAWPLAAVIVFAPVDPERARGVAIAFAAGVLAVLVGWVAGQLQPSWLRTRRQARVS